MQKRESFWLWLCLWLARLPIALAPAELGSEGRRPRRLRKLRRLGRGAATPVQGPPPPPLLPPPLPIAAGALATVHQATTEALINELHGRQYDWEVLERAGLRFNSVKHLELLSYLRRDAPRFRELLTNSSLGLSVTSTTQLLRSLSRRPDLAQALRETGLGAGSDFQCSFDESPRDGGCQIRCNDQNCDRAEAKCRSLSHCVSVDINRDRTWATLKSLQVFMPRPPPTCEGYVFEANGRAPVPIDAPLTVVFDDIPVGWHGLGLPQEDWCYRDTPMRPPHDDRCNITHCFELERCRPRGAETAASALRLYIDTPKPKTHDMERWPSCMRQTLRVGVTDDAEAACLVIPTVNINCEWDVCDPATHSMLRAMPSWHGKGRNHVIWDYIDHHKIKYRTDDALFMKTSMRLSDYRPGFDLPVPLLPNGEAARVKPSELAAARSRRALLASFKGVCQPDSRRPQLAELHNGRDLIMLCTDDNKLGRRQRAEHWDYKTLMLSSVFSVAPAGNGLHSFRLAEAIFFGSIPVIVDDEITLPFCNVLDWRRFSVRIRQGQVPLLPKILRAITPTKVAQMQTRLAEVKQKYFLFPFNTAMAIMHLRVRQAL